MVAGWLNHKQLQIIKGVGKTPGDSNSAEADPVVVNLMSGAITLDDWTPNIPQTKNGGVWVESPLSDGRELLAAAAGNVTEQMRITITDGSYLGVMKALSGLNQMASDCRDYWQTEYQYDPVYLAWWAGCGVGLQYALISNIEVSPEYQDGTNPTMRVSLAIEREPYWRGIPPGANPKIWTYYVNASHPQFNSNVATLATLSDHLITQPIYNKFEWSPTAYGLQTTPLPQATGGSSINYVDVPATLVPGDAPALVEFSISTSSAAKIKKLYVGKTSKKYLNTGHDGISRAAALNLNAGDSAAGSITISSAAVQGVVSNGSSSTIYGGIRTVTGVDANYVQACSWGNAGLIQLDREVYRGTFAVFVRACNNSAVTPVLTDMKMRVVIYEGPIGSTTNVINTITLPEVYVPIYVTNEDIYPSYIGTVTLPFEDRGVNSILGYGRQLQQTASNIQISVEQQVLVATANRRFTILDLILIPIDEGMALLNSPSIPDTATVLPAMDNTGYLTRGKIKQVGYIYQPLAYVSGGIGQEVRGQDIMLTPKKNQRLYFLNYCQNTNSANPPTTLDQPYQVRLNIVPRWAGIRDV